MKAIIVLLLFVAVLFAGLVVAGLTWAAAALLSIAAALGILLLCNEIALKR